MSITSEILDEVKSLTKAFGELAIAVGILKSQVEKSTACTDEMYKIVVVGNHEEALRVTVRATKIALDDHVGMHKKEKEKKEAFWDKTTFVFISATITQIVGLIFIWLQILPLLQKILSEGGKVP